MDFHSLPIRVLCALGASVALLSLAALATASGAATPQRSRPPVATLGALVQLSGSSGCLVDRAAPKPGCKTVRALAGPAPFLGSEAIAISPDAKNVYVASSRSNAIAVFKRNKNTGKLTQAAGVAGCIAAQGVSGCASGIGLEGPNSVTVSPDGRYVYAAAFASNAVSVFKRATKAVAGGRR